MPTRRNVLGLAVGAAPALVGLAAKGDRRWSGGFVFESQERGHRVRDRKGYQPAGPEQRAGIVVVGGGMGGLSAGWWLRRQGFTDFVVLEMEPEAGGNSRWGQNEVSAYPWGAHYVPVPNPESVLVRELLEELGVWHDGQWEERYLCHAPQERLFLHGRWQEGLEPEIAATAADRAEYRRFVERIAAWRATGAFTIPMALGLGKGGEAVAALDRLSFRAWLEKEGFRSPYLYWYCDYATRDDFGASAAETSAWAGIHYFAARAHEEKGPLTWAEGNGWILRRLLDRLGGAVRTGQSVRRIARAGRAWRVETEQAVWRCDGVVFAAPAFLAPHLIEGFAPLEGLVYSPWVVSNVTLTGIPEGAGEVAWDNVVYGSPSLGYVDALHQSLRTHIERTVWTHYWAWSGRAPAEARREMLAMDWGSWSERVVADLERPHRRIRESVSRVDVFRNGHAMARPVPGFLGSAARRRLAEGLPGLAFGHADGSGFSIFEEAQYRGVEAARAVLRRLGGARRTG